MSFRFSRPLGALIAAMALAVVGFAQGNGHGVIQSDNGNSPANQGQKVIHETNPNGQSKAITAGSTATLNPAIRWHGGPVLSTPDVYLIWYGNWNQSNGSDDVNGQNILRTLVSGLSKSDYFAINKSYSTSSTTITGTVNFSNEATDTSYSQTSTLSDSGVQAVVFNAINKLGLAYDANGVYFVLTSSDVTESSGFCTQYCGWHTMVSTNQGALKYAFVGNANQCLNACAEQAVSPNGNPGVDGMASVVAHELEEATSDPNLNAWFDSRGQENADKCAWTFGSNIHYLPSGAGYNMTLGGLNYLIQRNLNASNSKCYVGASGQQ